MKVFLYTVLIFLLFNLPVIGQQFVRTCATEEILNGQRQSNPSIIKNMEEIERYTQDYLKKYPKGQGGRAITTIPVVVHVVYDQAVPVQNISDAQIQSQIDILNQDFSGTNSEISGSNFNSTAFPLGVFNGLVSNPEIQFCLASQDPNGFSTTGITRKASTRTNWDTDTSLKRSASGGVDPWDRSKYLNIWVCRISLSTANVVLGYAQLPGGDPTTDGVVVDYRFFGNIGTAVSPFNKGRTATHEIGHWLNLKHIWGDASCGDDLVSDTPKQNAANTGCPVYPHLSTCTGTPVEMTMSYMDYTNDACMYMFSTGQKARMKAVLSSGAARGSLSSSPGCLPSNPNFCYSPSNLKVTNIAINTASFNWPQTANAINYSFEYKISNASAWTAVNLTTNSINISGLLGSTIYNARVKSNCSNGGSLYSPIISLTTLAPPTCNVPSGITTTNIKATSATSTWAAVANVIHYTYEYKISTATTWTVVPQVMGNTFQMTGLTPAKTYNVRIRTNCNGMTSAYSATKNFTTLAVCAGDTESNNTAATFKVTLKSGTAVNGKIGTSTDVDWYKFANTSSAKNIRVTLTNLPADYNVELYFGTTALVASSVNVGLLNEEIKYNNGQVGTYYIKVVGVNASFDNNNCYRLLAQNSSAAYRLGSTGMSDIALPVEKELLVFPNPSNHEVTLVLPFGENSKGILSIFDLTGQMVSSESVVSNESMLSLKKDIFDYKPGVYFVTFKSGSDIYTQKLVVGGNR
jgi:hypothetical protein